MDSLIVFYIILGCGLCFLLYYIVDSIREKNRRAILNQSLQNRQEITPQQHQHNNNNIILTDYGPIFTIDDNSREIIDLPPSYESVMQKS
jgi:hypothetical protein